MALAAQAVLRLTEDSPENLRASADQYRDELVGASRSLRSLAYRAVLVGATAAGKSTAETYGLDLLTPSGERILPTGGGNTTLCEVLIEQGDNFGFIIEPETADEIRRHIEDLCLSLQPLADRPPEERPKVPPEVRTALLNMAGIAAPRTDIGGDGQALRRDALRDLAQEEGERLISSLLIRLRLGERQLTEIWWDPALSAEPLTWVRENLRKINRGLHPEVSLPRRLRLILARPVIPEGPFNVTVADTRGVTDDVVRRPDLAKSLGDRRTVTVLCSSFLNAPDLYVRQLIGYADEQEFTAWRRRLVLLLLARQPEPPQVCYQDTGEPVETPEEGVRLKEAHTRQQLEELGPGDEIVATYDALSDPPIRFRSLILDRIAAMRADEEGRVVAIEAASRDMLESAKREAALLARQLVGRDVMLILDGLEILEKGPERPQDLLLRETAVAHQRSVWAMTRRRGQWYSLSLDLHLSDGAAHVARAWSRDPITRLTGVLDLLQTRPDLADAQGLILQLRETAEKARTDFIGAARAAVQATVWSPMHADLRLWANCEAEWRTGRGYRDRVVAHLSQWFRWNDPNVEDFCARIQTAWQRCFIEQVRRLCGSLERDAETEADTPRAGVA